MADSRGGTAWVENRPSRGLPLPPVRELWEHRELIGFLALRDLKVRYKQAAFGVGWALFQPIVGVLIFTLVFDRLAGVPSDDIAYPVFAFLGMSVWTYFSGAVTGMANSLVGNEALVTKVYFPRMAAPLAAVLPGLVDLGIAFGLLAVLMVVFGVGTTWALLALPLCLLALVATAVGFGLWLATLNVRYRDVKHGLSPLLQLWLFASPVAYPSNLVDGRLELVYRLNPMAGVIDAFRWSVLGGPWPGSRLLLSVATALLALVGGMLYFQNAERRFADVI
jgi:ABC-type polysaccharide/polyol phosphate export permease